MTVPTRWACFLVAVLLNACGGGDASDVRLPDPNAANKVGPAVTVSAPYLSGGRTYTTGGTEEAFEGGVCSGGNGHLSAAWLYGDGSSSTPSNRHTYPIRSTTVFYGLTVQCTDTASNPTGTVTAIVEVRP
jgi:hypothetical protein